MIYVLAVLALVIIGYVLAKKGKVPLWQGWRLKEDIEEGKSGIEDKEKK